MPKSSIISVGLSAIIFTGLIPFLELNETHLTNPEWPSHARLHEAWQLMTNAALSILAVVLVARRKAPLTGITIALVIAVSFLGAFVSARAYGGSMLHADGTQMAIGGVNLAVIVVSGLSILLLLGFRGEYQISRQGDLS